MASSSSDPLRTMHPNELAKVRAPDSVDNKTTWPMDQRRELLKRLLDISLEESIPTEGLIKAFQRPLTVEAFSSLITMDSTPLGDLENDFADSKYQKPHVFDTEYKAQGTPEGDEDLKRAHRAMKILTSDQPQINSMMRASPMEIIAPILRAFRCQDSQASVFHLCKVLDSMLKVSSEALLVYLTGPRMKVCFNGLLSNLHCSVVVDSLFNMLKVRPSLEYSIRPDTFKAYQKKLQQVNTVGTLLSNIVSEDVSVPLKMGSADLLIRLLSHYDSIPATAPNEGDMGESFMFKSLLNQEALEKLAKAAMVEDPSSEPALWVFSTLCKLAAKGKLAMSAPVSPVADEVDDDNVKEETKKQPLQKNQKRRLKDLTPPPPQPVEAARLMKLGNELKPLLKVSSITSLCAQALEVTEAMKLSEKLRHTSYEVTSPFGHKRLEWLRSLNFLLELDTQTPVPWKCLVAWQAQYPQNSLVQSEVCKALQTILVNSVSADECKPAISDCKLVSQLVKRAKEYDTDHAHVIKCLNLLRLKSDLLPKTHWLVQYLKSHSGWLEYLPELKKATKVTLEPLLKDDLPSQENPVVGHGFSSSKKKDFDGPAAALESLFMSDPDNPLTAMARQTSQEYAAQEKAAVVLDIELGSRYAKNLGFNQTTPLALPVDVKSGASEAKGTGSNQGGGASHDKKKSGGGGSKKKKKG